MKSRVGSSTYPVAAAGGGGGAVRTGAGASTYSRRRGAPVARIGGPEATVARAPWWAGVGAERDGVAGDAAAPAWGGGASAAYCTAGGAPPGVDAAGEGGVATGLAAGVCSRPDQLARLATPI